MFINKITKEYPRFIGDLQLLHPNVTLDNLPDDWALVEETSMPETQSGKGVFEAKPKEINGVWKQQWATRDLTTEEIAKIDAHNLKVREFLNKLEAVQNEEPPTV
jgi:hypothetical protein